jgi:DNA (cytosine-5)-methyltransferase 1
MDDLPARDESKIDKSKGGYSNVRETVVRPNFDRFTPAIERWEKVIGREAPAPTKPDGRDGSHRLSSEFTEWMMGLPKGWITGHGLSRKDELKACGNGVVPQQAELALRILLKK